MDIVCSIIRFYDCSFIFPLRTIFARFIISHILLWPSLCQMSFHASKKETNYCQHGTHTKYAAWWSRSAVSKQIAITVLWRCDEERLINGERHKTTTRWSLKSAQKALLNKWSRTQGIYIFGRSVLLVPLCRATFHAVRAFRSYRSWGVRSFWCHVCKPLNETSEWILMWRLWRIIEFC